MTTLKDIVGLLLLMLLLPLWMAVGLGFVGLVVGRHLYWWARGNTTAVSRGSSGSTPSVPPGASSRPRTPEGRTAADAAPAALAAAADVAGRPAPAL